MTGGDRKNPSWNNVGTSSVRSQWAIRTQLFWVLEKTWVNQIVGRWMLANRHCWTGLRRQPSLSITPERQRSRNFLVSTPKPGIIGEQINPREEPRMINRSLAQLGRIDSQLSQGWVIYAKTRAKNKIGNNRKARPREEFLKAWFVNIQDALTPRKVRAWWSSEKNCMQHVWNILGVSMATLKSSATQIKYGRKEVSQGLKFLWGERFQKDWRSNN